MPKYVKPVQVSPKLWRPHFNLQKLEKLQKGLDLKTLEAFKSLVFELSSLRVFLPKLIGNQE